jgi:hypothetical protein
MNSWNLKGLVLSTSLFLVRVYNKIHCPPLHNHMYHSSKFQNLDDSDVDPAQDCIMDFMKNFCPPYIYEWVHGWAKECSKVGYTFELPSSKGIMNQVKDKYKRFTGDPPTHTYNLQEYNGSSSTIPNRIMGHSFSNSTCDGWSYHAPWALELRRLPQIHPPTGAKFQLEGVSIEMIARHSFYAIPDTPPAVLY